MRRVVIEGNITRLKAQSKNRRRVNVYLEGEFAFGLSANLAGSLEVGQRLSKPEVEDLIERDAEEGAYQRAMRLLAGRPRTEFELRRYFAQHKVPENVQDTVLKRLVDRQWVDDGAFALAWVENRTEYRPRGAFALKAELRKKGVERRHIEMALEGFDEQDAALSAAQIAARKYQHLSSDEFRRRVGAYLERRGFRRDLIRPTVEAVWREVGLDESEELR